MTHESTRSPLQILLIEDSPEVLAAFQRMVESQHLTYACTIVSSLPEADRTLMLKEFDVIVADYSLGNGSVLSSFDLMNSTPTVFIIAPGDEAVAVRALHLGVFDYLTKDRDSNYLRILPHRIESAIAQKSVQIALRDSQERYRDLFENSEELLQTVSSTGAFMDVNPAWRRALGYSTEEVAKLNFFDLLPPELRADFLKTFQRVLDGENTAQTPLKLLSKSGHWIALEGNLARRMRGGVPSSVRAILRPLNERKAATEDRQQSQHKSDPAQETKPELAPI